MVTDEMVEKAARAMCEAWHYSKIGTPDGDAEWRKKQDQYRKQARAALEAALSAAEPVAWQIVGKLDSGSTTWKVVEHEHQAREEAKSWEKMCAVEVHPLYAAPSAPTVAITNAFMRGANYIANNVMMLDSPNLVMNTAKAATEYALSAQVQDVAGYEYRLVTKEGREYARLKATTDEEAQTINDNNFAGRLKVERRVVPEWEAVAAPAKQEG